MTLPSENLVVNKNAFFKMLPASGYIACVLVCASFFPSNACADSNEESVVSYTPTAQSALADTNLPEKIKKNLLNYKEKDYFLAYDVFVMNGKVGYAYAIAKAAVQRFPNSYVWRDKLVQSALWSGYSFTALEQWVYFIEKNRNPELYLEQAIILAGQLADYQTQAKLMAIQLKSHPEDKKLQLNYSLALQKQGQPDEAIHFIESIPGYEHDPDFLKQLADVAKGEDNPRQELVYLSDLNKLDKNSLAAEREAKLLYSEGNLSSAYFTYLKATSKVQAKDPSFWRNFAAISILEGKSSSVIIAYNQLLNQSKLTKNEYLQLVFLELVEQHKQIAYNKALAGYRQYKSYAFIETILSLGSDLEKWPDLKSFVNKLPEKTIHRLKAKPAMAINLANINANLGLRAEAYHEWVAILNRWPNLTLVQKSYLWFLSDDHNLVQLDYLLKRWCRLFETKPELWSAHVSALNATGNYQKALAVQIQHQDYNSYDALATLADLLVQNNHTYAAYYIGRKGFSLLAQKIAEQGGFISDEQQIRLIELMTVYGEPLQTFNYIASIDKRMFVNPQLDNQILFYALHNRQYSLASYIVNNHRRRNIYTPPWMTLSIALVYTDLDRMQELLEKYGKILPYRDRVTAAHLVGNYRLAASYAYQGLKDHPHDQEMFKIFKEIMLPQSNRWSVTGAHKTFGTAHGPVANASGRFFITPSLAVIPFELTWWPSVMDFTQLGWAPNIDRTTGFRLHKLLQNGTLDATIAERQSLDDFMLLKLRRKWRMSSSLNMTLSLNYHETSEDTTALLLAGMKNSLKISANKIVDSLNTLDAEAIFERFYGQEGTYLGFGEEIRGHWQSKFYRSYPDWNINFYGTWANFKNANSTISDKLLKIFPDPEGAATNFFMPINYMEGAITLGFGQEYRKLYTHDWKPFAEAGLLYSAAFGLGKVANLGYAGSVFGRDHLMLFASYSENQQQAQKNYAIGMRYDNYF